MAKVNATVGIEQLGDNSGVLELQGGGVTGASITASGVYVKSVTSTERAALTPVNGTMVYDTTQNQFYVYVNGSWAYLISTAV